MACKLEMCVVCIGIHFATYNNRNITIADGKEYDAYISVGKSPNDMKFIQRNIVDVLQRMYNYKFYIDDENLLPQLGTRWLCVQLFIYFF